ncbi:hypothetical protein BV898_13190 [Hypsibius exemplaris]|uniref:Mariner Mos1 transposase n=1 Tax=Hypsibius exemplaris TaxID=2072580 RepID=A0A1W0WBF3_HYPEX|nr:hypothetical protein BV898_13190 [Hypsibius exemplaris]
MKKVCSRWVPHSLSENQKQDRLNFVLDFLKAYVHAVGEERGSSPYESSLLENCEEETLKRKRGKMELRGLKLHHDNASNHKAESTTGFLKK